jgi:uncharacterized protein YacL
VFCDEELRSGEVRGFTESNFVVNHFFEIADSTDEKKRTKRKKEQTGL